MKYMTVTLFLSLIGVSLIFPSSAQDHDDAVTESSPSYSFPQFSNFAAEIRNAIFLQCNFQTLKALTRVDKNSCAHLNDDGFWRHKIDLTFGLQGTTLEALKRVEIQDIFHVTHNWHDIDILVSINPPHTTLETLYPPHVHKELFVRLMLVEQLKQSISWPDLKAGEFTRHYDAIEQSFNSKVPRVIATTISKHKFISEPFANAYERTIQIHEFGVDLPTAFEFAKQIEEDNLDPFYYTNEGILCYAFERNISLPQTPYTRIITSEDVHNFKLHYTAVTAFTQFYQKYQKISKSYPDRTNQLLDQMRKNHQAPLQTKPSRPGKIKKGFNKIRGIFKTSPRQ